MPANLQWPIPGLRFPEGRLLWGVPSPPSVRIDKWLWAVRLFRTRTLAAQACQAGHVKMDGSRVKPARDVRVGDLISVQTGRIRRLVRVRSLLELRVGARLVADYLEDLTPEEEYAKLRNPDQQPAAQFPRGLGRPTKKQRRQLDGLL